MALEEKDLQILAELGFCAVSMGNMLPARTIFNGLLAARPGHEAPRMGLAMSHYMVDEFEAAENILRELMQDKPDFCLSRAHLALCLILAGRKDEARPLLDDLDKLRDPQLAAMVHELKGLVA